MVQIKLKWNKEEYDLEVDEQTSSVEVLKTQIWTLTNVPIDKQKLLGFPGGVLKDSDELQAKVKKMKAGAKVTLVGTAEGGELKGPVEKIVFEEDLTPEEKARILKTKAVEVLPVGLENLGNTCYMNSVLHCLKAADELRLEIETFKPPAGGPGGNDVDTVLTMSLKGVLQKLGSISSGAVSPMQFVMVLRQRFPEFAQMSQRGGYQQQDAEECFRGLLTVLARTLERPGARGNGAPKNAVDALFGFKMRSKLKCLETDDEAPNETEESQRSLTCHLGTQTEPVSHLHQGVKLSLRETIEKNSPNLGRNAQYEKTSAFATLPQYFLVQFARFGFKAAHELAGTEASKVKLVRKCQFTRNLDVYDFCSDEMKRKLSDGRVRKKEKEDIEIDRQLAAQGGSSQEKKEAEGEDKEEGTAHGVFKKEREDGHLELERKWQQNTSAMAAAKPKPEGEEPTDKTSSSGDSQAPKPIEVKPEMVEEEDVDTGRYELVSIVSHKGRTADGGHYVGWARSKKADGKELKEDRWNCFDDETVTAHSWPDLVGNGTDLQGGKADTQIAYLCLYKRVPTFVPKNKDETESESKLGEEVEAKPVEVDS